jgi:hypothetical protein
MLTQLVYSSEVRDLGHGGYQAILDEARKQNAAQHVTGVLLYTEQHFLQCLEGGRRQVTETFCKIAADRRHKNVQLISVTDVVERDFTDWSMGYVPHTPDLKATLRRAMPTDEFDPRGLSDRAVTTLVKRLHDLYDNR